MAESKEITLRPSDVSAFVESYGAIEGDPIFEALTVVYNYGVRLEAGDEKAAHELAYEHRESIAALWRRIKENEKAQKQLKPLIEKICSDVPMPDYFKWQAGAKRTEKKIVNMNELWARLSSQGVTLDSFLSRCSIEFDDAILLSGKNEPTFLEEWGDIASVEAKQNKSTLKGIC